MQQPAIKWAQRLGQKLGYQQPQPPKSVQFAQNLATDWIWRPEIWQTPSHHPAVSGGANGVALNRGTKLFHSAARARITSRQIDQTGDPGSAPFGLSMNVYVFSGEYISLTIRLPTLAAKNLQSRHLIYMDCKLDIRKPLAIFARLKVENGPNTAKITIQFPTKL